MAVERAAHEQRQDRLMREDEVASLLGMSRYTLQSWRRPGYPTNGPRWINAGRGGRRIIRYRESEVQAWIAGLEVDVAT